MKSLPTARKFFVPRAVIRCVFALLASAAAFVPEAFSETEKSAPAAGVPAASAESFVRSAEKFFGEPAEMLFGENGLWQQKKVQKTEAGSGTPEAVFSAYLRGEPVLGVPAEEVKSRERGGKLVEIEILFFNKGDTAERCGFGTKSGKSAAEKMKFVGESWRASLDALRERLKPLGKETRANVGIAKMRRRALVWKCGALAILLDSEENEFVRISLVPEAELKNLTSSKTDRAKANIRQNVAKRPNGDVIIENIPMINQGEKGYCVPATIERILRYYGIDDLDMHEIANIAGTDVGGGTSVSKVISALGPVVKKKRLKFAQIRMIFPKIKQCTDRGIPMMWTLYSAPQYLKRLRQNTEARAAAANMEAFAATLKKQAVPELPPNPRDYAHICLIVGYNAKTKEICVSDSWGDRAAERWIRLEDAVVFSEGATLHLLER